MEPKLRKNTGNMGKGRPKGVPNKNSAAVKDMILSALSMAGGDKYFYEQAQANPAAFLTLVGKVIPLQLTGDAANPIRTINTIELVALTPHDDSEG